MGTLQKSVCWRLSVPVFFTAFLFFLDVFTVHGYSCAKATENSHRSLSQKLLVENASAAPVLRGSAAACSSGDVVLGSGLVYGQTLYMTGLLIGSVVSGVISDRYGKRVLLLGCSCLHAVVALLTAFLPFTPFYLAARCITGLSCSGINMSSMSLGVEWSQPKYRTWPPTLLSFIFSLGMMGLAVVAYLTHGWMQFHLVLALPQILCMPLYFNIPESPRWLLLNKRMDTLEKYRSRSPEDRECLDQLLDTLETDLEMSKVEKPQCKHTSDFTHLKSPIIVMRVCIMGYIGMASALTYFGISFSVGHFGLNIYLVQFFSGLSESPSLLLPFLLARCGRRPFTMVSLMASGTASLMSLLMSKFCDLPLLVVTLALVGKLCMQSTTCVSLLYGIELFPTVIRQKCIGLVNLWFRIGSIINAVVAPTGEIPLPAMICYSSAPILGTWLCLLLPETSGVPLPDSVLDCQKQPRLSMQCLPCSRTHGHLHTEQGERQITEGGRDMAGYES
ncbi:solute carrier family 22 member 8 [Denticeps clupeoides]|uniref:Major facilitator superfamily (MFS) profile domain-containing protein n=1 Tax=Denticeps clupeoides TaxID=299321 RepID=A0AAY4DP87_9TELE|nr:solute carrier family 22 member 8-like [Denticeps clupeoides]